MDTTNSRPTSEMTFKWSSTVIKPLIVFNNLLCVMHIEILYGVFDVDSLVLVILQSKHLDVQLNQRLLFIYQMSHIMPSTKIDIPLMVYSFSNVR